MKTLLCILFSLALVKHTHAQKLNVPDSLPFTLEYVDSIAFLNAKELQPKLIEDTSDFRRERRELKIYQNNKLIYNFTEPGKIDIVRPYGYYMIENKKWYVSYLYMRNGVSRFINQLIIPPYTHPAIEVEYDITISPNYDKVLSCLFFKIFLSYSSISIQEISTAKTKEQMIYTFGDDPYSDETKVENLLAYEWIKVKWHDDKTIYLHALDVYNNNKPIYLKMVLK